MRTMPVRHPIELKSRDRTGLTIAQAVLEWLLCRAWHVDGRRRNLVRGAVARSSSTCVGWQRLRLEGGVPALPQVNGLSYRTWLRRHPGLAPWEPGARASQSNGSGSKVRTTEILLAANAALLAGLLALVLARTKVRTRQKPYPRHPQSRGSSLGGAALAGQHGIGHISRGAAELVHAATTRMRERPGSQEAMIVYGVVLLLSVAGGVLVARYLGG